MDKQRRRLVGGASGLLGLGAVAVATRGAGNSEVAAQAVAGVPDPRAPMVSVAAFGARGDGSADDGNALRRALAWVGEIYAGTGGAAPRLYVPAGTYAYDRSPNFAVTALALECAPGVVFHHQGEGPAFVLDGGATGGGAYRIHIVGMPTIRGNARSGIGVDVRALHHSVVTANVRDVATAVLRTRWAVSSEFRIRSTGLGINGSKPVPVDGLVLEPRNRNEATSDCLFHMPIIEQVSNVGIRLVEAGNCTFLSGTSEANGVGGVHVGPASAGNTFIGLDLEFNGKYGILCEGLRNGFIGIYEDKLSTFAGAGNWVRGHLFNEIDNRGDGNAFETLGYAAAGGRFLDTGANTRKILARNLTSGRIDPDYYGGAGTAIAKPSGGAVRDTEAREAIAALTARLEALGLVGRLPPR